MERLFVKNIHQNIYKYDLSKPDVRCLVIESNVYTWYLYNWTYWVYILHIAQYKQICLSIPVHGRWNRRVEGSTHSYTLTEIRFKPFLLKYPSPQIFGPSTGTEVQAISTYYPIEKCPLCIFRKSTEGLSEQGLPWVPWHPQILADLLTLSNYAHYITTYPPLHGIFRPSYGPARYIFHRA